MMVELLYLPNCPHYSEALDLVRDVLKDEGIIADLTETLISITERQWNEASVDRPRSALTGEI